MGKVVGIVALKGGVGKTSCTTNLGASLAFKYNQKVLIVDTNFNAANLGFHVGLFEPKTTIHDVLLNKAQIKEAIHEYKPNLHVIPAATTPLLIRNPYKLKEKITPLRDAYDIILLDSSPSLNNEILSTMLASDELYVVASPDYPTLSTTIRAANIAKKKNIPIKGLILNKVRGKKFELTAAEMQTTSEIPVIGVIPDDLKMPESLAYTKSLHEYAPRAKANKEIHKIAGSIIGMPCSKDPKFFSRIWDKFRLKEKTSKKSISLQEKANTKIPGLDAVPFDIPEEISKYQGKR